MSNLRPLKHRNSVSNTNSVQSTIRTRSKSVVLPKLNKDPLEVNLVDLQKSKTQSFAEPLITRGRRQTLAAPNLNKSSIKENIRNDHKRQGYSDPYPIPSTSKTHQQTEASQNLKKLSTECNHEAKRNVVYMSNKETKYKEMVNKFEILVDYNNLVLSKLSEQREDTKNLFENSLKECKAMWKQLNQPQRNTAELHLNIQSIQTLLKDLEGSI